MKEIKLTRGLVALVDDEDFERVNRREWIASSGQTQSTLYAVASGNPWLSMHRFILGAPADKIVDHKDHNGLNNQRNNLRITTYSGNQHNRVGVKGYYYETGRGKWYSSITIDGVKTYLGRFDREEDAAEAYNAAKKEVLETVFGNED